MRLTASTYRARITFYHPFHDSTRVVTLPFRPDLFHAALSFNAKNDHELLSALHFTTFRFVAGFAASLAKCTFKIDTS